MHTTNTITVGLSGGVDSSVAAYLLKQQGHHVHGIFMKNWQSDDQDQCPSTQDFLDAQNIASQIGITISSVNFIDQYWQRVFQICLDEFAKGNTPNPDILCNKEIKFDCFLKHALDQNATAIATGHYARIHKDGHNYQLLKAKDSNKDQSYFLYRLNQYQLSHCVFPLGELTKPEVRNIAKQQSLINAQKKDSTGICFIGEQKFKPFLSQFLLSQPGNMIDDHGNIIGQHDGLMFYTLGQRKGLNIGGRANAKPLPWYVVGKDIPNNTLIISQGHDHPALLKRSLLCHDIHWISGSPPALPLNCSAKIRYRQNDASCTITQADNNHLQVTFDTPQWAITPGQSVVFYQGDLCLGGAIIGSSDCATDQLSHDNSHATKDQPS
jgi:tRNA-uridine 2-sulfurtransferase